MPTDEVPAEKQIDVSVETDRLRKLVDRINAVGELKRERDEVVRALSEAGLSRQELADLTGLSVHGVDAIRRKRGLASERQEGEVTGRKG